MALLILVKSNPSWGTNVRSRTAPQFAWQKTEYAHKSYNE